MILTKKRSILAFLLVVAVLFASLLPTGILAKAEPDTVTIEVGNVAIPEAKDDILTRVNEIRKDAYNKGIVPEYVEIKWSSDMEEIAFLRVLEANMIPGKTRPNGTAWDTVTSSGGMKSAEEIQAATDEIMAAIEIWFDAKGTEYNALINPDYKYLGFAATDVVVAEFTDQEMTDETQLHESVFWYAQEVEITKTNLKLQPMGDTKLNIGDIGYAYLLANGLWIDETYTYESDKPSVVSIDEDGIMTPNNSGTAKITMTVQGQSASLTVTVTKNSPHWVYDSAKGKWWYDYGDGTYPYSQFLEIQGQTYYFDADGWMVTGWQKIDNHWYYFQPQGPMMKGWVKDGNTWYYMNEATGIMQTGWIQVNGKWYFLYDNGAMATGWAKSGQYWYYLDPASGVMQTGWKYLNGNWYYLAKSGPMCYGWIPVDGKWYYLKDSGEMVSKQWVTQNNKKYYLTDSGAMAQGWVKVNNKWYYTDPKSGEMKTGWQKIKDFWYYLDPTTGEMKTGWLTLNNKKYFLHKDTGLMHTGWLKDNNNWYYMDQTSGEMKKGWVDVKGIWFYLDPTTGVMQTGWINLNNNRYFLHEDNGMMHTGWLQYKNNWYFMDKNNGAMQKGLIEDKGKLFFLGTTGIMEYGWKTINSRNYYFGPTDGAAYENGIYTINGVKYAFCKDAVLATYVLDNENMTFHKASCSHVAQIIPKYIEFTADSRSVVRSKGYEPCTYCKP